jgi:hypothetical protein
MLQNSASIHCWSAELTTALADGEVDLMNPWSLHGSGINQTNHCRQSRRAFSVYPMDAATKSLRNKRLAVKNVIFVAGAPS